MRRLVGFAWADMASIYARSMACALATVLPLLIAVVSGVAITAPVLVGAALAGCLCWTAALFVVRHPATEEFVGLARGAVAYVR
jgi:hypothetical protein